MSRSEAASANARPIVVRRPLLPCDSVLLLIVVTLLALGYVMVTSASLHIGERLFDDSFHYPRRQLLHIVAGMTAAVVCSAVPLSVWQRYGCWLLVSATGLLGLVLIPGIGIEVNGSVRWLSLGGIRLQVSELVKLFAVLYLSGAIVRRGAELRETDDGAVRPLLPLLPIAVLLLLEPDFGATAVILATAFGMLFLAGARLRPLVLLLAGAAVAAAVLIVTKPYRWQRLTSFRDPWDDPLDSDFQLIQALIALGQGEWGGVGLGGSVQKLYYLPEAHTDFLFSVIGEELGLVGVLTVIVLFAGLVWRALAIGARAEAEGRWFGALVAYGLGLWFGLQSFINMGVNMGLLPTKGLTLPLMSYGGSSMVVMCAVVGVLCRVHGETGADLAAGRGGKERAGWPDGS